MTVEYPLHGVLATPTPPPGVADDWTVPQHWDELTAGDHWVWDTLFARQQALLHGRAVSAFERGLDVLHLSRPGVPNFDKVNDKLHAKTGFSVVAVPGMVPDDVFFRHLSKRQFPAAVFIRAADQLDYLEEPDLFHDVFGHVPLLADPAIADVMQTLGHLGLESIANGQLHRVSRLYWYSVEFGLARETDDLRIYGAGILSSFSEVHYSLESPKPKRVQFDIETALRTRYRADAFQQAYFVIDHFEDLLSIIQRQDVPAICRALDALEDLDPGDLEEDIIGAESKV